MSGPIGRERVHYEGPPAPTVSDELERLVERFNRTAPGERRCYSAYPRRFRPTAKGIISSWAAYRLTTDHAEKSISFILAKARFWQLHRDASLNERQQKALDRLFAAGPGGFTGGMTASKYMNLTHCSKATATRDLTDLGNKGCLEVFGGGRSVRYSLAL